MAQKATAGKQSNKTRTVTRPTPAQAYEMQRRASNQRARAVRQALKARAQVRLAERRKKHAQSMGVSETSPMADPPVSTTMNTLLTAEEQALWVQSGLPIPSDAELLAYQESVVAEPLDIVTTTSTEDVREEEEESSGAGLVIAAGVAAVAAFLAFS